MRPDPLPVQSTSRSDEAIPFPRSPDGKGSGWTAKGCPRLAGYAWYRVQVEVSIGNGGAVPPLAIRMPDNLDDAYQVYVNGRLMGAECTGTCITLWT